MAELKRFMLMYLKKNNDLQSYTYVIHNSTFYILILGTSLAFLQVALRKLVMVSVTPFVPICTKRFLEAHFEFINTVLAHNIL